MTSTEPKLIYFAERHPSLEPGKAFTARWRTHAALGMSMPRWTNIRRYLHCDAWIGPSVGLPTKVCDGVALVWYRSEAARLRHQGDTNAGPLLKRDELETFARPVREFAVLTEESILLPDADDAGLSLFLTVRSRGVADADSSQRWQELWVEPLRRTLQATVPGAGYRHNAARRDLAQITGGDPLWQAVEQLSAAEPSALAQALGSFVHDHADALEVADVAAVWTTPFVLHDLPMAPTDHS